MTHVQLKNWKQHASQLQINHLDSMNRPASADLNAVFTRPNESVNESGYVDLFMENVPICSRAGALPRNLSQ